MNLLARVGRLWRTARHLRAVQIYRRLWFRIHRPRTSSAPAPALREACGSWIAPAERSQSLVAPSRFRFLAHEEQLANIGWDGTYPSKLWRYNQHYFDDLTAARAEARSDWHRWLIADWIASNPPARGTGWEPYPTSLRIVNWVKWALAGHALSAEIVSSLVVQVRWLTSRLEWHLLGNHLFVNAKALVFAGLFFDGPEAESWLAKGIAVLRSETIEQILPDGGQFELSPMYHALAVEDLLDLINVTATYGRSDLASGWGGRVPAMLSWLNTMSHPDGGIAFFNDAAFGIAPDNAKLFDYARRLGFGSPSPLPPVSYLQNSGYARMSAGDFLVIADFARIGPDYLPGHAHADTLSFEFSFAGQRVFVNSGTSEYSAGPERCRQRGTAAHNTVVVAGENSSEVWAGFRVGRRANPKGIVVEDRNGMLHGEGGHDGYRHLRGTPKVHRSFDLDPDELRITDTVFPQNPAEARFHIHPAIEVRDLTDAGAVMILPRGALLRLSFEGALPRLENTSWHPEFGVSESNLCLVLPLANGRASLIVTRS